jgi:hypothetical protein
MPAPYRGISGNQGSVIANSSSIAELIKWAYDEEDSGQDYNAVSGLHTDGKVYNKTVEGNKKANGSIEGKYDSGNPIGAVLTVGALITLVLYQSKPNNYYSFQARIRKIHKEADIDSAAVQPFTADYVSDGPITKVGV